MQGTIDDWNVGNDIYMDSNEYGLYFTSMVGFSHVSEVLDQRPAFFLAIGALVHSDDSVGPVTDMKKKN